MDLRKRIYVHPYHQIDIPLGKPYEIDDEDGNPVTEYGTTDMATLDFLLEEIEKMGIDRSEYKNVHIRIDYSERHSDPAICMFYKKPKSQAEMNEELCAMQKAKEKALEEKERQKRERVKKKNEKQKIIDSLTTAQKKALGYK